MKTLVIGALAVGITAPLSATLQSAIAVIPHAQFDQSELVSDRYTYRGTGRREILS